MWYKYVLICTGHAWCILHILVPREIFTRCLGHTALFPWRWEHFFLAQAALSSFAASRFMLVKVQGTTAYSCVSFMEWLLWLEDISLTFLPQSIYLHFNTSLHLTKFWKTKIWSVSSEFFTPEVYTHARTVPYRRMCQCRKTDMQTNRPLRVVRQWAN